MKKIIELTNKIKFDFNIIHGIFLDYQILVDIPDVPAYKTVKMEILSKMFSSRMIPKDKRKSYRYLMKMSLEDGDEVAYVNEEGKIYGTELEAYMKIEKEDLEILKNPDFVKEEYYAFKDTDRNIRYIGKYIGLHDNRILFKNLLNLDNKCIIKDGNIFKKIHIEDLHKVSSYEKKIFNECMKAANIDICNIVSREKPYKLRFANTNLYYTPSSSGSNLSVNGKVYTTKNNILTIFKNSMTVILEFKENSTVLKKLRNLGYNPEKSRYGRYKMKVYKSEFIKEYI